MADTVNVKLTQKQFDDLNRDMALDLEAFFNVVKDEIIVLMNKAVEEKWTPEQLIEKIEDLI